MCIERPFEVFALVLLAAAGYVQVPSRLIGEVTALDPAGNQLTIRPDSGGAATVSLDEKTVFLRVPPGETDLKKAVKITRADVGVGDRILARGSPATSVIVMTKADLTQKHQRDRAEWQRRGVAGVITALNPETREISITARSREGPTTIVIEPVENVTFRRYAPDSVRFSDARPSSFAELGVGDQVRVLGDRSADGLRIRPEEIVSGAFRNIAGAVTAIDAKAGELRVTDLVTREPLTVRLSSESMLRRIPPMMAGARPGGPPRGMPNRNLDFSQILERMPALSLNELKPGDAIIVSSTVGAEPSRLTAIVLVAGVEALLGSSPEGDRPIGGTWNFDIGLP